VLYQLSYLGTPSEPAVLDSGGAPRSKKAGLTGLEPATSYVTGRHSNQLSYSPAYGTGIRLQASGVMMPDA
jgi:hypothetical protein